MQIYNTSALIGVKISRLGRNTRFTSGETYGNFIILEQIQLIGEGKPYFFQNLVQISSKFTLAEIFKFLEYFFLARNQAILKFRVETIYKNK